MYHNNYFTFKWKYLEQNVSFPKGTAILRVIFIEIYVVELELSFQNPEFKILEANIHKS